MLAFLPHNDKEGSTTRDVTENISISKQETMVEDDLQRIRKRTRIIWQKTLLAINITITTIGIKGTGVGLYSRNRIMAM